MLDALETRISYIERDQGRELETSSARPCIASRTIFAKLPAILRVSPTRTVFSIFVVIPSETIQMALDRTVFN